MEIHKRKSNILVDIVLTVFSHFSILLTSFIQTTILIRLLNLEQFGIYGVFSSTFALGISLGMFGIDKTITRIISKDPEKNLQYFSDLLTISIILAIGTSVIFYFFLILSNYYIYQDIHLLSYLQYITLGLSLAILSTVMSSFLRGLSEMRKIAIVTMTSRLIGLIISFVLIIVFGLLGGILGYINYYLLELVFYFMVIFSIKKRYSIKLRPTISKKAIKIIAVNGSAYHILGLTVIATLWTGISILDVFSGHEEVGIYQVGNYIFAILQQIGFSLVFVLFPKFSSISNRKSDFSKYFYIYLSKTIKFSFAVQFIIGLFFITIHNVFMFLFNLEENNVREVMVAFIFIAPIIFGIGYVLIDTTLYSMSEYKILFLIRFTFLFSYSITAVITVQYLGALALVLSMVIGWFLQIIIAALFIRKKFLGNINTTFIVAKGLVIFLFYLLTYLITYLLTVSITDLTGLLLLSLPIVSAIVFVLFVIFNGDDRLLLKKTLRKWKQLFPYP